MQKMIDPYAVFLGFAPGQPPKNYYELLGLPVGESDLEKIAQAVERLRNQVRHIRPGAYLAQWQQILDELTAAKICLLDPVAKALYDEALQKGMGIPLGGAAATSFPQEDRQASSAFSEVPQPPGGPPSVEVPLSAPLTPSSGGLIPPGSLSVGAPLSGVSPPASPSAGVYPPAPEPPSVGMYPSVASPLAGGTPYEMPPGPSMGTQIGYPYTPVGGAMPMETGFAPGWPTGQSAAYPSPQAPAYPGPQVAPYPGAQMPAPIPVGSVPPSGMPLPGTPPIAPPIPGETTQVAAKKALAQSRRSFQLWVASCVGLVLLAIGLFVAIKRWVPTRAPVIGKASPETKKSEEKPPQPDPNPKGSKPQEPSTSPSPGGEKPKTPSPPKEVPIKPPTSVNPSAPPQPPATAKPDPAKQAAWQKAVEEVRLALAHHDLTSAEESLQKAKAAAQTPQEQAEVERLEMLRHYLGEFWKVIRQVVGNLQPGEELVLGKQRMAVVEGNDRFLIVRAEGKNHRWEIEKLPAQMVELLAKRGFRTSNAAAKLAYGAYYAVEGNTTQARQFWQEAEKNGVDVSLLLEELSCWPLEKPQPPEGQSPLQ